MTLSQVSLLPSLWGFKFSYCSIRHLAKTSLTYPNLIECCHFPGCHLLHWIGKLLPFLFTQNAAISNFFKYFFCYKGSIIMKLQCAPAEGMQIPSLLQALSCSKSWFFYIFTESITFLFTGQKNATYPILHVTEMSSPTASARNCSPFCTASVPTYLFFHLHVFHG